MSQRCAGKRGAGLEGMIEASARRWIGRQVPVQHPALRR